jgi:hypothetical protein
MSPFVSWGDKEDVSVNAQSRVANNIKSSLGPPNLPPFVLNVTLETNGGLRVSFRVSERCAIRQSHFLRFFLEEATQIPLPSEIYLRIAVGGHLQRMHGSVCTPSGGSAVFGTKWHVTILQQHVKDQLSRSYQWNILEFVCWTDRVVLKSHFRRVAAE